MSVIRRQWFTVVAGMLLGAAISWGASYLMTPAYLATTSFLTPQQSQSAGGAAALASLGSLAGLTGGAATLRTPAEQYVALLQSVSVSDRVVDQFGLMEVYEKKFRVDARKVLARRVKFIVGKRDGLISISVDDPDKTRAADMANGYVEELRRLTSVLAVTEAQQRRQFFEQQLAGARDKLTLAQSALQSVGLSQGALKAEPRAAADSYARLKSEAMAAEVRLQALRNSLSDTTPEVQLQASTLAALRAQLAKAGQTTEVSGGPDYVARYREFKYQETLFEMYARQFELARVDESREGVLIQVVDKALPPEKPIRPDRPVFAASGAVIGTLVALGMALTRGLRGRASSAQPRAETP